MKFHLLLITLIIVIMTGCAHTNIKESALTPGMTKKFIVPGKTGQTEVLEIFGPPDLVSRREGLETWTYDKISQDVTSSNAFLTIILAGYSRDHQTSHNRSMMLILYFDKHDVVNDYRLSSAQF